MKSYTNIEQSKKLTKILPGDSADMCWGIDDDTLTWNTLPYLFPWRDYTAKEYYLPCWSLAALVEQFEDTAGLAKDYGLWFCYDNRKSYRTKHYDNPVDACVEMIINLHEEEIL